jgi:uncharacterized membrane protein YhhN
MRIKNLFLHLLLPVIILVVLMDSFAHIVALELIFKPLIMVWIATYFIVNLNDKNHPVVFPALIAFFFSWIGDIALMFAGIPFFFSGLAAFLIAHLSYIYTFLQIEDRHSNLILRQKSWLTIPFIAYAGIMFWILFPGMDNLMSIATAIYTITILTMAASALNRKAHVPAQSFSLVMTGAILFICSDSLIAVNKFAIRIPYSDFWIMSGYILAQFLIMIGLLAQVNHKGKVKG